MAHDIWIGWIRDIRFPDRWIPVLQGSSAKLLEPRLHDYIHDPANCWAPVFAETIALPSTVGDPIGGKQCALGLVEEAGEQVPCAAGEQVPCARCNGTGRRKAKRCRNCNGAGQVSWPVE